MPQWTIIILSIACAQGFFLVILLSVHKKNSAAHRLLASILCILSFEILNLILAAVSGSIISAQTHITIYIITEPLGFLLGPLYYFYISFFSKQRKFFSRRDLLHGIPFLLYSLYNILFFTLPTEKQHDFVQEYIHGHWEKTDLVLLILLLGHFTVYLIASYRQLVKFSNALQHVTSNLQRRNLNWLRILTLLCSFVCLGGGGAYVIFVFTGKEVIYFEYVFSFAIITAIYYAAIKTYTEPEVLSPIKFPAKEVKDKPDMALIQSKFKKICQVIENEQLYLEEDLNTTYLASRTNMQPYLLSQIINTAGGKNFYQLINSYRINHAMSLLKSNEFRNHTILRIAYDSGFNSKATFNAVFKKNTGMTPTEYRLKETET